LVERDVIEPPESPSRLGCVQQQAPNGLGCKVQQLAPAAEDR